MKVIDVIKELPEETDGLGGYNHGFSQARNIILNSEIDISKVIDVGKIKDLANEIENKIIADLTSRRGLRQEWDEIDRKIRNEIEEKLIDIIFQVILTNINQCLKEKG